MPIPTIDFAPFLSGSPKGKAQVAAEIDAAARDIGFFLLDGHGVERPLIEETYAAVSAFFDLPEAEKLRIKQPAPEISRGYTPFQGEGLAAGLGEATPPDLKEMIDIGPVDVPPPGPDTAYWHGPEAGSHFQPNLWPAAPEGFEATLTAYYRRMNALADDLMRAFALALDLPEAFFVDKLDRNMSALRLIRYPELSAPPRPGQLRGGAHTDYGTLTILAADRAVGGLQAQRRSGEWVDVAPAPGTYVVNIGDAMQVWTNDRWVS
ncbi:MAG: 2-oxoglutarate and iron-dependent oxygenase domain-containing protein, partial [Pseudomonadota bacterium]